MNNTEPEFTFVERLFLSNQISKIILAHIILLAKWVWECVKFYTIVLGIGALFLLIIAGYFNVIYSFTHHLVHKDYISSDTAWVVFIGLMFLPVLSVLVTRQVIKKISNNHINMIETIKDKKFNHKMDAANEKWMNKC